MIWRPVLYSCLGSHGTEYSFDIAPQNSSEIIGLIRKNINNIDPESWLVGSANGKVFFGHSDYVGNHLGWKHNGATEHPGGLGRRLQFFMGYAAPVGTPLPQSHELDSLKTKITEHLAQFGNASWEARGQLKEVMPVTLPVFGNKATQAPASIWDKAVAAFNSGQSFPPVVRDQKGERILHHPGKPQSNIPPAPKTVIDELRSAEERYIQGTKKNPGGNGNRIAFAKIISIGLLVVVIGIAASMLLKAWGRRASEQDNQTQHR